MCSRQGVRDSAAGLLCVGVCVRVDSFFLRLADWIYIHNFEIMEPRRGSVDDELLSEAVPSPFETKAHPTLTKNSAHNWMAA